MRINTNVSAMEAYRSLTRVQSDVQGSLQKLSSGFRINRAADDAAGLGIANKLRADTRALSQAQKNAEQANSLLQVAEGGLQTISKILERMKELATQAASDNTDSGGRTRIQAEFDALRTEISKTVSTTKFQGKTLLDGNFGTALDTNSANSTALAAGTGVYSAVVSGAAAGDYTLGDGSASGEVTLTFGTTTQTVSGVADGAQSIVFDQFGITVQTSADFTVYDGTNASTSDGTVLQVDAGSNGGSFMVRSSGAYSGDDNISLDAVDVSVKAYNAGGSTGLRLGSLDLSAAVGAATGSQVALTKIDEAIGRVNTALGSVGAAQNRIGYAIESAKAQIANFSAAESVIRDVDMAEEMTKFSKNQILAQAGTAMLAQANQSAQGVLQLLRG